MSQTETPVPATPAPAQSLKFYLSMAKTFKSLIDGQIKLDDLRGNARMIFGNHKDVIGSDAAIPIFVMGLNKDKPRFLADHVEYVDSASVDPAIAAEWLKFKIVVREAAAEARLEWCDGKHYPGKARPLLKKGHEVFFDGRWMTVKETDYLEDKPDAAAT